MPQKGTDAEPCAKQATREGAESWRASGDNQQVRAEPEARSFSNALCASLVSSNCPAGGGGWTGRSGQARACRRSCRGRRAAWRRKGRARSPCPASHEVVHVWPGPQPLRRERSRHCRLEVGSGQRDHERCDLRPLDCPGKKFLCVGVKAVDAHSDTDQHDVDRATQWWQWPWAWVSWPFGYGEGRRPSEPHC